jgi:hypothetical protein
MIFPAVNREGDKVRISFVHLLTKVDPRLSQDRGWLRGKRTQWGVSEATNRVCKAELDCVGFANSLMAVQRSTRAVPLCTAQFLNRLRQRLARRIHPQLGT